MIANYYALVTEIDTWVGKIFETLDELGLSGNTFSRFASFLAFLSRQRGLPGMDRCL